MWVALTVAQGNPLALFLPSLVLLMLGTGLLTYKLMRVRGQMALLRWGVLTWGQPLDSPSTLYVMYNVEGKEYRVRATRSPSAQAAQFVVIYEPQAPWRAWVPQFQLPGLATAMAEEIGQSQP